ncbi:hypothetical protein ACRAWD_02115 [Caulobacter segnis]
MARAPKVFTWSDGFHRYTVAATSRAKALAAWETDRDLFKEGVAREAPDAPDAKAALAAPGAVIRRAEAGLPAEVAKLPKAKPASPKADKAEAERKRKLAEAEQALETAEAEQRDAEVESRAPPPRASTPRPPRSAILWTTRRATLERAIRRLRPR